MSKVTSNDVALTLETSAQAYRDARQQFVRTQNPADNTAQLQAKKRLDAQLSLLAVSAALAARGATALRLAQLREADEGQQYAVRQRALSTRSYEQILLTGAQRLSLYYQGGIRPDTLARILNAAGTLGLIPTIVSK